MGSKTKQSLVTGAAILGVAAFISKLLGAVYRVPYQNITGDVGLGIFSKVYPLYSMLLILATAGFPIAISKIVSERLALGDKNGAKKVFTISVYVLSITGLIFFALLYFGAHIIAVLMGNADLTIAIRSVSFALLVVPVMAALRGYYQGHQYMTPTAYSQVIEQIVRVITILSLSYYFMVKGYGVYYAGAGAVFGATTGAIFAFIILLLFWNKVKQDNSYIDVTQTESLLEEESVKQIIKRILYYSIPIAVGALAVPLMGVVDSFSVSNLLIYRTIHAEPIFGLYIKGYHLVPFAEYWFGIYTRGQPLVQFASFFAAALFLALVPSISEANIKKQTDIVAKRSEFALRLTLLVGLPATIGLAVLAGPVSIMLYKDAVGSDAMAILAFTTIFSTLFVTSSGILQGVGKVILPARNLFIGIIVKIILNILLIYMFQINGAALATVITYAVVTILNIIEINRHVGLKIGFISFFIKPLFATLLMGIIVFGAKVGLLSLLVKFIVSKRLLMTIIALLSVMIGFVVYGLSLFLTGAMTRWDLEQIPRFGRKLIHLAEKVKILRD